MKILEKLQTLYLRANLLTRCYQVKTYQDMMEILHEGFMRSPYGSDLQHKFSILSKVVETDCEIFRTMPNPTVADFDNLDDLLNYRMKDLKWLIMHG